MLASFRPLLALVVLFRGMPCRGGQHPRLFLTPDELAASKARTADTHTNALGYVPHDVWKTILEKADRFADGPPYHHEVLMPGAAGGPGKLWQYAVQPVAAAPPRRLSALSALDRHVPGGLRMRSPRGSRDLSLAYK